MRGTRSAPSDPEQKARPLHPWHVIERAADLHILCRETAVLVDWIDALESRYKELKALDGALDNKYSARMGRPLGRLLNKVSRGPRKKRLRQIWKELDDVSPARKRLLVRLFILNLRFIADSIYSRCQGR
jgi:hypothetical protein